MQLTTWVYLAERGRRFSLDYLRDWLALIANYNALDRFRRDFGVYTQRRYILPLNSGTSANEAAVYGLGIQPGDEVICPAAAPIFVSLPVLAAGAIPIFADVDQRTLISGPDNIKRCLSARTRAIVVVHQAGQPAPMNEIMALAREHQLQVVEDCAQAHNSYYQGQRVGTFGDIMCSSFQQSKHLTSGEGGFIATDDPEIYRRSVLYSTAGLASFGYGMTPPEPEVVNGFRVRGHWGFGHIHRMSSFQAAVACSRLKRLDSYCKKRSRNVDALENVLQGCPAVKLTPQQDGTVTNYWQYPIQLDPTRIEASAVEVVEKVLARMPRAPIIAHDEINYLEHVFQEMERNRYTPHGQAISEEVSYAVGICPVAEEVAKRSFRVSVHHSIPAFFLRRVAMMIRNVTGELGNPA
jgi:perosamine synthetase